MTYAKGTQTPLCITDEYIISPCSNGCIIPVWHTKDKSMAKILQSLVARNKADFPIQHCVYAALFSKVKDKLFMVLYELPTFQPITDWHDKKSSFLQNFTLSGCIEEAGITIFFEKKEMNNIVLTTWFEQTEENIVIARQNNDNLYEYVMCDFTRIYQYRNGEFFPYTPPSKN